MPVKAKQAGRSHKNGRTDYRLREGNTVNLRVGIKHRVIYSAGRSNANLLILTGLSGSLQHRVEDGLLCVCFCRPIRICVYSIDLFESKSKTNILD